MNYNTSDIVKFNTDILNKYRIFDTIGAIASGTTIIVTTNINLIFIHDIAVIIFIMIVYYNNITLTAVTATIIIIVTHNNSITTTAIIIEIVLLILGLLK